MDPTGIYTESLGVRNLRLAIRDCDLTRVQQFANEKTIYERDVFGRRPVHYATADVQQLQILQFLLDTDSMVELMPDAMIGCLWHRNLEAMKVTCTIAKKRGLDINCHLPLYPAVHNLTPLTASVMYDSFEMFELLLQYGADVSTQFVCCSHEPMGLMEFAKEQRMPSDPRIVELLESVIGGAETIKSAK